MFNKNIASKKAGDKALKLTTKIEAAYEKEDEQMMIRLIKIRDSLWTWYEKDLLRKSRT